MFNQFHIAINGKSLCHQGGILIKMEDARSIIPASICNDCQRRFLNMAKMMGLETNLLGINKARLRKLTEEENN